MNRKIDVLEKKHCCLETNQIKLCEINQIMIKRLGSLVEKDQYFEKLLIFVLKIIGQNFNINYDMLFSDPLKSENKQTNGVFDVIFIK